jgi:transcriptional regulator with XRE-family HTH domain
MLAGEITAGLAVHRSLRGLTQRQLARRARVCQRTISSIEAGRSCRHNTQRKLLRALGLPFESRSAVFPGER